MSQTSDPADIDPFVVKDCTLTAMATGEEAQTLREFRERLKRIPEGCLYYHFWGHLLRPLVEEREFNNDFAEWAAFRLRDRVLAERLALVDPANFEDAELLREEVLDLVEERLHEEERSGLVVSDRAFHFIESQLVVFDTHRRASDPSRLAALCPELSQSSVFYHFVDARQRPPHGVDDFQLWLEGFGEPYSRVCQRLSQVDLYFSTLDELRNEVTSILRDVSEAEAA